MNSLLDVNVFCKEGHSVTYMLYIKLESLYFKVATVLTRRGAMIYRLRIVTLSPTRVARGARPS